MQKYSFFLLIFLVFSISNAQNDSKNISPKLQPLMNVLRVTAFDRILWELTFAYSDKVNKLRMAKDVIADIASYLEEQPEKNERSGQIAEYKLLKKYNNNLINMFNNLNLIGVHLGKFIYSESSVPVKFALKENDLTFLLTSVVSEYTYNTLRSTAKERAAKVIGSMILPSIEKIYKAFIKTDIKYIGMVVTYGSKDFSDESIVLNLKAEMIALVVPMAKCKDYVDGKITEEELLDYSDAFQSNRDMVTGIKKIKVSIE